MIATNSAATRPATQGGHVPTIERYRSAKDRQRKLEHDARQAKKEADTLEGALSDAVDANGGMMSAGPYVLGFEMKDGVPAYKGICEAIVAEHGLPAGIIVDKVSQTPQRRVLVIA